MPADGTPGPSALRVAVVHPDLLSTYGDAGNALVLRERAERRGLAVEVVEVAAGTPVPLLADIYLLGGGEDRAQVTAAGLLRPQQALPRAVARGATVLAVCGGYQLLGEAFATADGEHAGLGLLDVRTTRAGQRLVGHLVAQPDPELGTEVLVGYENHAGRTALGPDARPLGRVLVGAGNAPGCGAEGALQGSVVGTYLHGPLLALNARLADALLARVTGPLPPLDDAPAVEARRARLARFAGRSRRRGVVADAAARVRRAVLR